MGEDLEKLKQRFSLLDYLRQQNWVARPAGHGSEFVGLCPLHRCAGNLIMSSFFRENG